MNVQNKNKIRPRKMPGDAWLRIRESRLEILEFDLVVVEARKSIGHDFMNELFFSQDRSALLGQVQAQVNRAVIRPFLVMLRMGCEVAVLAGLLSLHHTSNLPIVDRRG